MEMDPLTLEMSPILSSALANIKKVKGREGSTCSFIACRLEFSPLEVLSYTLKISCCTPASCMVMGIYCTG